MDFGYTEKVKEYQRRAASRPLSIPARLEPETLSQRATRGTRTDRHDRKPAGLKSHARAHARAGRQRGPVREPVELRSREAQRPRLTGRDLARVLPLEALDELALLGRAERRRLRERRLGVERKQCEPGGQQQQDQRVGQQGREKQQPGPKAPAPGEPGPRTDHDPQAGDQDLERPGSGAGAGAGVIEVRGDFEKGDAVRIVATEGTEVARGIARYDAFEAGKIRGMQSVAIAEALGYVAGSVLVHAEDLVLTGRK